MSYLLSGGCKMMTSWPGKEWSYEFLTSTSHMVDVDVCSLSYAFILGFFIVRGLFWIVTLRTYMVPASFSSFRILLCFCCILKVTFLSQVSEWKSCIAARRRQREHIIWIPTAAAQTLYWMYKELTCGQQGMEQAVFCQVLLPCSPH